MKLQKAPKLGIFNLDFWYFYEKQQMKNNIRRIKKMKLIKALVQGEKSGVVKEFDSLDNLKKLHRKYLS